MSSLQNTQENSLENSAFVDAIIHNSDFLDTFPCAICLIRDDSNLTIIRGNSLFYALFECTEEEMRHKYANCMSALIYTDSLWEVDSLKKRVCQSPAQLKLHVKRNGGEAWIYTQVRRFPYEGAPAFCCVSFDITQNQQRLQESDRYEKKIRLIAKQIKCDIFGYNLRSLELQILQSRDFLTPKLLGELPGGVSLKEALINKGLIHPDYTQLLSSAVDDISRGESKAVCDFPMKLETGEYGWARLTLSAQQTAISDGPYMIGVLENITQQKELSIQYLNETQFYQAMLSEKTAFAHVDVTLDRFTRFGGMWNLYNEIINTMTYSQLIEEFINKVVHPEDRKHYLELMQRDNFIQSLDNGVDQLGCEFRRIVEQNKMMWMELRVHLFRDPFTHHVLALQYIKNIDERKKHELTLLHDSERDHLTNIFNKKVAESSIRELLKWSEPNEVCAFLILDVDNFKFINDTYGHKTGDQVLVKLTLLLRDIFRRDDIIGRFGGDEFIIFLRQINSEETIRARLDELYQRLPEQREPEISCSIGVSLVRQDDTYEQIFRQADIALYEAKRNGKGKYMFYKDTQRERAVTPPPRPAKPSLETLAAKQLLSAEEVSFESFLGEQGDLAYLVDPDNFNLICGNKAFYDRIGMTRDQCADIKCYEAMHRRRTPCPFCSKANWSTDKFYLWRNLNAALEQEFLIKNKLVQWNGKEALLAISVDISNNKSIVDSMDNGATESHCILSGVQRMADMANLEEAMKSALESIGYFFRADGVRFFERKSDEEPYVCVSSWNKQKQSCCCGDEKVNNWLLEQTWNQHILIESPEAMLCYSYDMYQYMKKNNIVNQRWVPLRDGTRVLGFIDIENITSNFQNVSFLESFLVFVAGEMKKRRLTERILYSNEHDDMTGLLSRTSFERYVQEYNADYITQIGVLTANVDDLKNINSTKGFPTGNRCLKQFSDMLQRAFPGDPVFRLNGDEFLVISVGIDRVSLEADVQNLKTMVEEKGAFTVSIGYSWDNVENDLAVLIEQSAEAMRVDKERHHDANPVSISAERRRMLSELTNALENREFEVFLQPKVELSQARIVGAEALIRYRHKELGIITPDKFIGTLEKNNLIRYIDLFVFEETCRILEKWRRDGIELPVISLNFSRLTLLERDILSSMEKIIGQYDVDRKYMEIEITESVASMGKGILYQAALELYHAGFNISLDDFGTKYTNLSILADIDFSMLKLDKSLIGELVDQNNNQIILKNIIYMCEDLGIEVIAEGVENQGQEEVLRKLRCKLGQGYLYGKPMPIQEFFSKYAPSQRRV